MKPEFVIKRNGKREALDLDKIYWTLKRTRPEEQDLTHVMEQALREGFNDMTTGELERALIQAAASFIEQDPSYGILASGLFLQRHYKEVMGISVNSQTLTESYRQSFIRGIRRGVETNVFDRRLVDFDLEKLAGAIDPDADGILRYIGLQTLAERYFV